MIRIYLNIQRDHRYDRINAIGGYISTSNADDSVQFGHVASAVPDSVAEATALEEELLTGGLDDLFGAIQTLGAAMDTDQAAIHFYFFTNSEYETLVEAVTRQDILRASAVRDLLGLRLALSGRGDEAFDHDEQAMVSIIQRELHERRALGIPTVGLLPALDVCDADEDTLYRRDWEYTRSDGVDCAHLERSIEYRNADLTKRPVALDELSTFTLGESDTARAATEFLALEHESGRRDQLKSYGLPVTQRIRNGEAVPVVVTDAWVDGDTNVLHVDGHLPYDPLFDDGERVARACRLKETDGSTMGSWVVANRLDRHADPQDSPQPQYIEHGPALTVEDLDIEERAIHLTAFPSRGQGDREYRTWHRGWTTDPDDEDDRTYLFSEDEIFILDKQTDDIVSQRAYDLLGEAQNNTLCELLDDLAAGRLDSPTTDAISDAGVRGYLE